MNASVNRHINFLADGYIISHAHPFSKTPSDSGPVKSHHHSESELLLYNLISDPITSVVLFCSLMLIYIAIPQIFSLGFNHPLLVKDCYQVHHYHAPPI